MAITARINVQQIELQKSNLANLQVNFRDNLQMSINKMREFKESGLKTEGQFEMEFEEKIEELTNLKTKIDLALEEYIDYLGKVVSTTNEMNQQAANTLNAGNLNNITGVFGGK